MLSITQVIVSETQPTDKVDGLQLSTYNGYLPLDQKFDITSDTGPLRGRWITILQHHSSTKDSLMLAEVRVYGGKCILSTLMKCKLLLTHTFSVFDISQLSTVSIFF